MPVRPPTARVVGRKPTMTATRSGMRTEPPVSVPMPPGEKRAATATRCHARSAGIRVPVHRGCERGKGPALLLVIPKASS